MQSVQEVEKHVPVREGDYGERVATVEPGGVEYIALKERHGKPIDLFWTWLWPGIVDARDPLVLGAQVRCPDDGCEPRRVRVPGEHPSRGFEHSHRRVRLVHRQQRQRLVRAAGPGRSAT